jgi:nitrate reductase gamma subunit
VLAWNARPLRLYVLELSALTGGLLALVGLANIIVRRITSARARKVTSTVDWVLYVLLFLQMFLGVYTAVVFRWGASWFAAGAAPYLWSLATFQPDIAFVTPLPLLVKAHVVGAFLVIALFPFTRLVHILVIPNMYLWRKPQVVIWNRERAARV